MSKLSLIVAMDQNRLIGNSGKLPWHIPWDLQYFKRITMNANVIMGRRTYESIGKVLPNRTNIIITSDQNYIVSNGIVVNYIEDALRYAIDTGKETFVIGGSSIYEQSLHLVDLLYLNEIQAKFEGDSYFPQLDQKVWSVDKEEIIEAIGENGVVYTIKRRIMKRI